MTNPVRTSLHMRANLDRDAVRREIMRAGPALTMASCFWNMARPKLWGFDKMAD